MGKLSDELGKGKEALDDLIKEINQACLLHLTRNQMLQKMRQEKITLVLITHSMPSA